MWVTSSLLKRNFLVLVFLFIGTACSLPGLESEKEADFAALYPNIPMKGYLDLILAEESGSPDVRRSIDIVVVNISDQVILFSGLFDHDLYRFDEDQQEWVPIDEKMVYINDKSKLLYPEDNFAKLQDSSWATSALPDLVIEDRPVIVRVVMVGEILENEQPTGKEVGAYLDVTYEPNQ